MNLLTCGRTVMSVTAGTAGFMGAGGETRGTDVTYEGGGVAGGGETVRIRIRIRGGVFLFLFLFLFLIF